MKITKQQLKKLIKEEIASLISEAPSQSDQERAKELAMGAAQKMPQARPAQHGGQPWGSGAFYRTAAQYIEYLSLVGVPKDALDPLISYIRDMALRYGYTSFDVVTPPAWSGLKGDPNPMNLRPADRK